MIKRGSGRVLNVASLGAFQPLPSVATYAATKAFVLSLSEALAEEVRGTGVTVTALCPGLTATNMVANAQKKSQTLRIFHVGSLPMPTRLLKKGFMHA